MVRRSGARSAGSVRLVVGTDVGRGGLVAVGQSTERRKGKKRTNQLSHFGFVGFPIYDPNTTPRHTTRCGGMSAADEDDGFAERLRSIRDLRLHWEERLASEGALAAPARAAASPRDEAGRRSPETGLAPAGAAPRARPLPQAEADPEALLTEAIRLTTLAQPP